MSLPDDLLAFLRTKPCVNDTFGKRVFYGMAPQDVASPFTVFRTSTLETYTDLAGGHDTHKVLIEFNVYNESSGGTADAVDAIKEALDNFSGTWGQTVVKALDFGSDSDFTAFPAEGGPTPVDGNIVAFEAFIEQ